jgi:outer membrane lipoprotein-sorting protein
MRAFPFIAFFCVSVLFSIASAQQPSPENVQRQIAAELQRLQSPRQQVHFEADHLVGTRSIWNGRGTWMPLGMMLRSGGEVELGLTEEQKTRLAPA